MKLHYMGKYSGDPETLPALPHKPNYVKFKEPENSKKAMVVTCAIAFAVMAVAIIPLLMQGWEELVDGAPLATILAFVSIFPHEFVHAICFKHDVYLYTNFKHGAVFIIGPEDMSKARFIFMSLLPNLLFAVIPYIIFLLNPDWMVLGVFSLMSLGGGAGDYMNVYNALTQMPKGARTYLHQFTSYWYIPEK